MEKSVLAERLDLPPEKMLFIRGYSPENGKGMVCHDCGCVFACNRRHHLGDFGTC